MIKPLQGGKDERSRGGTPDPFIGLWIQPEIPGGVLLGCEHNLGVEIGLLLLAAPTNPASLARSRIRDVDVLVLLPLIHGIAVVGHSEELVLGKRLEQVRLVRAHPEIVRVLELVRDEFQVPVAVVYDLDDGGLVWGAEVEVVGGLAVEGVAVQEGPGEGTEADVDVGPEDGVFHGLGLVVPVCGEPFC